MRTKKVKYSKVLLSSLITPLPLFTTPILHAADDELFFDMPVVLSASRLEQPVADAAVSISVIDRETIEASGARTIPEVLRLVPGMQVGYSGNEFGAEPAYVVAYHGHSDEFSRQMQVLIDGRSIYDPFIGGINWKFIPVNINDIERIEVSRGPNLTTYGSNSFQAAINIITRTAAEDQGSYVQTNIGTNDIADLTYRYGGSNGKLDYRITGSSYHDAGLDSANVNDYRDDTHSNKIDYRIDYQLDNKNTLSYQGGIGINRQQAEPNHDGLIPTYREVENERLFQFIKWENVINQNNTLLLQYYYNLNDKTDESETELIDTSGLDPFTLEIKDNVKSERHNLELTHFISANSHYKMVWGLSAQTDIVRAPLYLGTDEDVTNKQLRAFANIEWLINPNNIINFGALAEKNDFTDTELSPRISLTHVFNKQHSIRLGVSQAIRSPFIYEAKADRFYTKDATVGGVPALTLFDQKFLGSATADINLQNERIISREIAYYGNFFKSSLQLNARLFHDDITDYINQFNEDISLYLPAGMDNVTDDLTPGGDNKVRVYQNITDTTTTGLELEMDYRIDPTLRLVASGAIINVSSSFEYLSLSAPQHSFSLLTSKRFNEHVTGSLGYYFVEAFSFTDSRGGTDDYRTLDMRLSRSFRINDTHGSLSIVVKNMLQDYSDYQAISSNSPGEGGSGTAPIVVNSTLAYLDFRLHF